MKVALFALAKFRQFSVPFELTSRISKAREPKSLGLAGLAK